VGKREGKAPVERHRLKDLRVDVRILKLMSKKQVSDK
jgi:hypothetical protein